MNEQRVEDIFSIYKRSMKTLTTDQNRIYTDGLVMWLGIYQEIQFSSCRGSLDELRTLRAQALFGDCRRKREGKVSSNSGALVQARQKLEIETLQEALYLLYQHIRKDHLWHGYRVIGVDGSTVQLNKSNKKLLDAYPSAQTKHGRSRWPHVLLTIMIDLLEGTVMTAAIGAKYGEHYQSEQSQTTELLKYIKEEKTIIVGDRNFGSYQMVRKFEENGAKALVRLSTPAVTSLIGSAQSAKDVDKEITWYPTREMQNKYGYQANEGVEGRIIIKTIKHKGENIQLRFFTTIKDIDVDELIELYKCRWAIEGDIKVIKLHLRLKSVQAETKSAVGVEIFCKFMAYNITRGAILLALQGTDIAPRRISYAIASLIVRTTLSQYAMQRTNVGRQKVLDDMSERIRLAINPLRPNRSHPRQIYRRNPGRYKNISCRLEKN